MSQIKPKGPPAQREEMYRSEEYRRHVAQQPCMACGWSVPNDEGYRTNAAHIGNAGRGRKAHDWLTIPLCTAGANDCHGQFDSGQERFSQRVWGIPLWALKVWAERDWLRWRLECLGRRDIAATQRKA